MILTCKDTNEDKELSIQLNLELQYLCFKIKNVYSIIFNQWEIDLGHREHLRTVKKKKIQQQNCVTVIKYLITLNYLYTFTYVVHIYVQYLPIGFFFHCNVIIQWCLGNDSTHEIVKQRKSLSLNSYKIEQDLVMYLLALCEFL